MNDEVNPNPVWVTRGKTIKQLISELQRFENQDLEVRISSESGKGFKCISIVGKQNENGKQYCGLENCE